MTVLEKKIDALMRYASADSDYDKEKIRMEIRQLLCETDPVFIYSDKERAVRKILLDLNAPDHMIGYCYTTDAILLVIQDEFYLHNLKWGIYAPIAQKNNTSITAVDHGISNLIEGIFYRTEFDKLNSYFKGIITDEKDRPTNGQFIARLANIIKYELREEACEECR